MVQFSDFHTGWSIHKNTFAMAKKTVSVLQTNSKRLTKAVRLKRSQKSGAYVFEERMVPIDQVNDFLSGK